MLVAVIAPERSKRIELALTLSSPASPVPVFLTEICPSFITFRLGVLIVKFPDEPLGSSGKEKSFRTFSFSVAAEESIIVGFLGLELFPPLTATELEALIVRLPARPLARVEVSTLPPS